MFDQNSNDLLEAKTTLLCPTICFPVRIIIIVDCSCVYEIIVANPQTNRVGSILFVNMFHTYLELVRAFNQFPYLTSHNSISCLWFEKLLRAHSIRTSLMSWRPQIAVITKLLVMRSRPTLKLCPNYECSVYQWKSLATYSSTFLENGWDMRIFVGKRTRYCNLEAYPCIIIHRNSEHSKLYTFCPSIIILIFESL